VSFLAVIAALMSLHVRHVPRTATTRLAEEFAGGLAYVRAHPALIELAVLGFTATFLANPVLTFLPLIAKEVFQGDVPQYTYLLSGAGAGAVTGALVVAWLGKFPHMGRTALLVQLVFGTLVALFAISQTFWLSVVILFGAGACMVMVYATLSSLVQLHAPNELRGRVMSIYMVAFRGGTPIGSLLAGWIATRTGAPTVLMINGVLLSLVAAWFLLNGRGVRDA
jgi:predicted MFS family arabinose efflux permease